MSNFDYTTCPVCGVAGALLVETTSGKRIRTCRTCGCPLHYLPVYEELDAKESLAEVGYEVRSEAGDCYFIVKGEHGFLCPKTEVVE